MARPLPRSRLGRFSNNRWNPKRVLASPFIPPSPDDTLVLADNTAGKVCFELSRRQRRGIVAQPDPS